MKIGYARVSTVDQNPELQLDALKKAGCKKVFTEHASGAQRERPELIAALAHLREGDTLVVWKLDRLARTVEQLVRTINDLRARGIEFLSLTETINTGTPAGKLTFHLFSAMAEFERDLARERSQAALAAARARGRMGGRPRLLDAKAMRQARAMLKDESISRPDIALTLGVSTPTLYRALRRERRAK